MENTILDTPMSSNNDNFDERVNNILTNGYSFDLGEYLSKGSAILKGNIGSYIGYLVVSFIISMVASVIFAMIPVIGSIASNLFSAILWAGMFIVAWRIVHDKPYSFSNFFDGFKFIGPLVLLTVMKWIFMAAIALIFVLIAIGSDFENIKNMVLNRNEFLTNPQEYLGLIRSLFFKIFPLLLILMVLFILWSFSTYIVVFAKKGFWEALTISSKIVGKKFFGFFGFFLLLGLINVVGAICLLVGLLYTIPLTFCAMFAAYHSIVGTTSEDIQIA